MVCRCDKHTDKYSGEYQTDHKKGAEAWNRYLHSTLSAEIKNTFSIKGTFLDLDYKFYNLKTKRRKCHHQP